MRRNTIIIAIIAFISLINIIAAQRREWPEMVGIDGYAAKSAIRAEDYDLYVEIHRRGYPLTADYREDRVRIITNSHNIVTEVPTIG